MVKVRLGESLLRFLNKINVVRSIGEICAQDDPDPAMRKLATEALEQVLDEWDRCDVQDDERRQALISAGGRIAAASKLDADVADTHRLREQTLQALFSGLRDGYPRVRDVLQALRDSPHLTDAQKRDIDDRLSKAFGLVRVRLGP
jgi:hypothetical protein